LAVLILTFAVSFFLAGALWFSLGSRLNLSDESDKNQLLNLIAYFLGALPFGFVLIFFGLGG
jgi:hypothetical protein